MKKTKIKENPDLYINENDELVGVGYVVTSEKPKKKAKKKPFCKTCDL